MVQSKAQTNEAHQITSLTAFISVDAKGNEGIMGARLNGELMPLVVSYDHLLPLMRETAQHIAKEAGVQFVERRFVAEGGAV